MQGYIYPAPVTLNELRKELADWGLADDNDEYWEAWKQFDNHGIAPQGGGWLDWDIRIRTFFRFCFLLKAFHKVPNTPIPKTGNDW